MRAGIPDGRGPDRLSTAMGACAQRGGHETEASDRQRGHYQTRQDTAITASAMLGT